MILLKRMDTHSLKSLLEIPLFYCHLIHTVGSSKELSQCDSYFEY